MRRYFWPREHWRLVLLLVQRELATRFRGSVLGGLWFVLGPLLLLLMFTLVLREVMQVRWPGGVDDGRLGFALRLYAGLALYYALAEGMGRAPGLVTAQPQLVKKVAFPLELLGWVNAVVSLAGLLMPAVFLVAGCAYLRNDVTWAALSLPLVWLPMLPLLLGVSWLLSGLGTYVRDVTQLLPPVISLLMFLSPIFYPVEALPAMVRPWMAFNPLATPVTQTRRVLLEGQWPDWSAVGLHALGCLFLAVVGAALFHRVRKGFADVV